MSELPKTGKEARIAYYDFAERLLLNSRHVVKPNIIADISTFIEFVTLHLRQHRLGWRRVLCDLLERNYETVMISLMPGSCYRCISLLLVENLLLVELTRGEVAKLRVHPGLDMVLHYVDKIANSGDGNLYIIECRSAFNKTKLEHVFAELYTDSEQFRIIPDSMLNY